MMTRRRFLSALGCAPAANGLWSAAPATPLGYDSYSIRAYRWKALQHLEYAAKLELDTVQISGLGEYESLDEAHLKTVRTQADSLGVAIEAGIGSICPTSKSWNPANGTPEEYIAQGLRVAKIMGSTSMRCFVGSAQERRGELPVEAHIESTVKVLRNVRSRVMDHGVTVGIENHNGDLTARELRQLVETAGREFVGVCYDSGNPMWLLEDPAMTLEILAPYVVTSHFRDTALFEHQRGCAFQWVALGDGSIGLKALVEQYARLCPGKAVQLEIITGRPPQILPYLEGEYWKAFPHLPAADFARFLRLVRAGRPYLGPMMIGAANQPLEYEAALNRQQMADLERSLRYAKDSLGLGVRWKE
ncbi:MAG: sugar phosphate isomerase/epimerase [Bryobacteraceae bacterium]|nr:sugar phosphate isomerase/epimerase [Bryobacteraceae bacterium]